MTHSEFETVLQKLMEKEQDILVKKAKTYSYGDNRFHNFQELSLITGNKPPIVAFYLMLKHFIAFRDWLFTYDNHEDRLITAQEMAQIEEFVVDLRNYLALIYAMLYDVVETES